MEERHLDLVVVPFGLLVLAAYHLWLLLTILRHPKRTVIGINALARQRWVRAMMADPMKNGVLAVQTVRNNIMASTVLATTAVTLASLIGVFVGATSNSSQPASALVYGNKSPIATSVKFFAIAVCFLVAFLCHVQSIRHYAHVSFLVAVPTSTSGSVAPSGGVGAGGGAVTVEYAARCLNRGGYCWSLGLRAFYVSFTLFLWIFGPIPMLVSCVVMCVVLYFLDITRDYHPDFHHLFNGEDHEVAKESV